jgi:glyoxylate reductase
VSDLAAQRDEAGLVDVFVTRRIPAAGTRVLEEAGLIIQIGQADEERYLDRGDLLDGARRCRVVLSLLTESIDEEILSIPTLLGVANMAVGFDNIDVAVATDLGVPVSNTPGVLSDTTADIAWALILGVARHIPQAHAYTASGRFRVWGPNSFLGADVGPGASGRRKVLGIVGFGRIGQAVARRAVGFEMRVVAHDPRHRRRIEESPHAEWAEWPDLLRQSDFLTLHAPLRSETRHLIGENELRAMKPSAFLINTARGPLVDEAALVRALEEGWISGAGLDVYEHEPRLEEGLAALDNVVLLPHIGSASLDTRSSMASMAAINAVAHLRLEKATNAVNPEVYGTSAYRRRTRR